MKIEELVVGLTLSKCAVQTAVLFISVVIFAQAGPESLRAGLAYAQSTPVRSTPTPIETPIPNETPVRNTPTPIETPILNETPVRSTPTPIETPVPSQTPVRPTPPPSSVPPPPQDTPTVHRQPETNPTETLAPAATPNLLPVTGVAQDDTPGPERLLALLGLGIIGGGLGAAVQRWRQHRHNPEGMRIK